MADILTRKLTRKELEEMDEKWDELMWHWKSRKGFDQKEKARINNIMHAEKTHYPYR